MTQLLVVPSMSNNVLSVFDLATHEVVTHLGLPKRGPGTVFTSPDGQKLYVLCSGGNDVVVVDVARLAVDKVIEVPGTVVDRGKLPDQGRNFWVSVILQGHIHQVDTTTGLLVRSFPKLGPGFTVSGDEQILYTLQMQTRKALGLLKTWSVATSEQLGEVELPRTKGVPLGLWRHGTSIYFTEMAKEGGLHVVDVADPAAPAYVTRIAVGAAPIGLEVAPDGSLWLPNSADGTVSVIDSATNRVVHTLDVGHYVGGVTHHDGRAYLNQSIKPAPGGYWRSMWITVPAPYLGVYVTPRSGQPRTRRFLDIAAEVVAYDAATYERLPLPTMTLPSISFTSAVIERAD